jgi:hypothetical protein
MGTHIYSHRIELPKAEAVAMLGVYDIIKHLLAHAKAAPELAGGTPIINLMSDGNDWAVTLSVHTDKGASSIITIAREDTLPELHAALAKHRITRANKPSNN